MLLTGKSAGPARPKEVLINGEIKPTSPDILCEVNFGIWDFEINYEKVKTFRVYKDKVYEFLNESGNPILQGWIE